MSGPQQVGGPLEGGSPEVGGPSELDADTAVEPGEGGWTGTVHRRWNVGANPNGGYTLALAARAMLAACGRDDPLTVTAHYVAPPAAGPVAVGTEIVRAGRRYATVAASMRQEGRELLRLVGAFGDLGTQQGPTRVAAAPPAVAAPEDCVRLLAMSEAGGYPVPEVTRRYDLRLDPDCQWITARSAGAATLQATAPAGQRLAAGADDRRAAGAAGEGPLPPLEAAGWIRFADGSPPSTVGLLAMADAFPPTLVGTVDVGWVPTVELTVHVRGRPAPGWVLGVTRTRFLVDGILEQDGELWDCEGRLVALCRQMALVLPRR